MDFKNIEHRVFLPSVGVLLCVIIPIYLWPTQSEELINAAFSFCTHEFGWLYMLTCIAWFAFIVWVSMGKRGETLFGSPDEKPEYGNFAWMSMLFTSGVGTSIIILGFLEPIYYVTTPPFHLEPFSRESYEFAHMYGQFHWGLSAWAFYSPAIVAVGHTIFNRKKNVLCLSSACEPGFSHSGRGVVKHLIDVLVAFGIIGSISTSLGLGTPVIGAIGEYVFSIPPGYDQIIKIIVLLIWMCLFSASLFQGLDKGLKRFSSINVWMALAFMVLIFLYGPSVQMIKMEINSLGLYMQNFVRLNTWMDPFASSEFVENWTIFYWGWWIAFMPMMGLFVARISRGRSIRSVVWGQMFWGSLGCAFSFAVFGGYALYLQQSGQVDVSSILHGSGQTSAMLAILKTLPFHRVVMLFLCLLCFIYLTTTIDSCAYVLASITTRKLAANEQPARWNRILWGGLFCLLSFGLMQIGGLKAVQTLSIVTGLPLVAVVFILIRSVSVMLKQDKPRGGKRERLPAP